jgi:biotin transport system permease protein
MTGPHRPSSWLTRLSPGVKLLALAVLAAGVVIVDDPVVSAVVLLAMAAILGSARIPAPIVWRAARPLAVAIVVVTIFQVLIGRPREGVEAALRLAAVAAAALAVTLSTTAPEMVLAVERGMRAVRVPERRVFRTGLVVGVALRSLDHLAVVAARVLDARRARGLQRSVRAFAVPTVVGAARFAHGVGEALEARGIADPSGPAAGDATAAARH